MCGIAGLFLKNERFEPELGRLLAGMLGTLCDRGPDSAGFAVYGAGDAARIKLTLRAANGSDFAAVEEVISEAAGGDAALSVRATHATASVPAGTEDAVREVLAARFPHLHVVSYGKRIEIYKEVGRPDSVAQRFQLDGMCGSHAIGHTRMATESVV